MLLQKLLDLGQSLNEISSELGMAGADAHQNETADGRSHEGLGLEPAVADPAVRSENDPFLGADDRQPVRILRVLRKMIVVELDPQTSFQEDAGEDLPPQAPVAKEDDVTQPVGRGARSGSPLQFA